MDLEAKLTEEMEGGLSDNESSTVESAPFDCAPPSSGSTINPPLFTVTYSAPPVTPNVLVTPAHLPGVSSTATGSGLSPPVSSSITPFTLPYPSPPVTPSPFVPASTKVSVTPVNTPKTGASSTATTSGLNPPALSSLSSFTLPYLSPPVTPSPFVPASTKVPVTPVNTPKTGVSSTTTVSSLSPLVMSNLTPSTLPYQSPPVKSSPFVPAFTTVPVTPVNTSQTGVSSITVSSLSLTVMSSLSPWAPPCQPPFGTSSVNVTPVPSAHGCRSYERHLNHSTKACIQPNSPTCSV